MKAGGGSPTQPLDEWRSWWRHNGERELRDLMLVWWDPVGAYGEPDALDEYDSYVPTVGRMLREGAGGEAIAAHLREIETTMIELSGDSAVAAQKIIEWHDHVMRRLGWSTAPGQQPPV